jgi:hypothetical protein
LRHTAPNLSRNWALFSADGLRVASGPDKVIRFRSWGTEVETMVRGTQTTAQLLREKAERCRRLARQITDIEVAKKLLDLAQEFEQQAASAEHSDESS